MQQTDHINLCRNFEPSAFSRDPDYLSLSEYLETRDYLSGLSERASRLEPDASDGGILRDELMWSLGYLLHGCRLGIFMTDPFERTLSDVTTLRDELKGLITLYKKNWSRRNKPGGFKKSSQRMYALLYKYEALIKGAE